MKKGEYKLNTSDNDGMDKNDFLLANFFVGTLFVGVLLVGIGVVVSLF